MALEQQLSRWGVLFPPGTPVLALPSWRRPRLLVPARSRRQIWVGTRFYPAYRWTGRLFHTALRVRALARLGAAPPAAGGGDVQRDDGLADFLADVAPEAAAAAVQVGMPGGAQKLTARLVDARGRTVGFLKCAEQPLARARLRHEHDVLRQLPAGAGPVPLKYGSAGGLDLLLLAPVAGRHPPPALAPTPALRRFVAALAAPDAPAHAVPIDRHPWCRALADADDALGSVASALDALAGRPWPRTFRHGDLAPWNLLAAPSGALVAIDWEYGSADGLPGLDLAQYVLQVALLLARCAPDAGLDAAARALAAGGPDPGPLSPRECRALAVLAAFEAHHAARREGLPDDDPRQRWRRAVWTRRP